MTTACTGFPQPSQNMYLFGETVRRHSTVRLILDPFKLTYQLEYLPLSFPYKPRLGLAWLGVVCETPTLSPHLNILLHHLPNLHHHEGCG